MSFKGTINVGSKVAILLVAGGVLFSAIAVPYPGIPHKYKQPDGSGVTVFLYGDECYIRADTLTYLCRCRKG